MSANNVEDIHKIMEILPHRYPFLLIDRVLDYTLGESLQAIKNVTINEPFFQGHFPGRPVFPGVLILEAVAQASAILASKSLEEDPGENVIFLFAGIDKARFKRPVEPGDQLLIDVKQTNYKRKIWKYSAVASVEGSLAASADIIFTYRNY
ncbi:MAG: 3-hydroxyacyl-ACP dehydratase FabZ [Acidiferrobacterales bacterium]|nr:3-hydroxyacyl-ACP dehydratase FabZ [Acidiferrobacterales bacterium]